MADIKNLLSEKKDDVAVKGAGMEALLQKMAKQIAMALPNDMSSERFRRVTLTAFRENPKLAECEPISFIAAMMQAAQFGLEPNTPAGEAYLIPYMSKKNGKERLQVQFQVGYQGLLNLAYRSGLFCSITAREVCENDFFELDYGSEIIKHNPPLRGKRGEVYGYYAKYETKGGGRGIFYMSKEEAKAYGMKFSKSYNRGPWATDFDAMAKKTCIKQLLKYAPKSIEYRNGLYEALNVDGGSVQDFKVVDDEVDFVLDYSTPDALESGDGDGE